MKKLITIGLSLLLLSGLLLASGSIAGTEIDASSVNIILEYGDGGGGTISKDASVDNIPDVTSNVMEINGLVETNQDITALGTVTENGAVGYTIFKELVPGTDHVLSYTYLNRGNNDERIQISAAFDQLVNRWSMDYGAEADGLPTVDIAIDALQTFVVTINLDDSYAFERTTLDMLIDLVTPNNVVSYNAFASAVSDKLSNGGYGGLDNFDFHYVLEAQGYDLEIADREISWTTPNNYGAGTPLSASSLPPGTMLTYTLVVSNNNAAVASSINLSDTIPANCHLYYVEGTGTTPDVTGATYWEWQGATENIADENTPDAIKFEITIPGFGIVTANYSITID